jgi:hypothetical protein
VPATRGSSDERKRSASPPGLRGRIRSTQPCSEDGSRSRCSCRHLDRGRWRLEAHAGLRRRNGPPQVVHPRVPVARRLVLRGPVMVRPRRAAGYHDGEHHGVLRRAHRPPPRRVDHRAGEGCPSRPAAPRRAGRGRRRRDLPAPRPPHHHGGLGARHRPGSPVRAGHQHRRVAVVVRRDRPVTIGGAEAPFVCGPSGDAARPAPPWGSASTGSTPPAPAGSERPHPYRDGTWQVSATGAVTTTGTVTCVDGAPSLTPDAPIVALATAPTSGGYWLAAAMATSPPAATQPPSDPAGAPTPPARQ